LTAATLVTDPIDLSTLPTTFSVRLNKTQSVSVDLSTLPSSASVSDVLASIKSQINLATRAVGSHVEADVQEVSPGDKRLVFKATQTSESTLAVGADSYVDINGTRISGGTQDELADNINAAGLGVTAYRRTATSAAYVDATSTVVIDGRTFTGATLAGLVSNINSATPSAGVSAEVSAGNVKLTASRAATIGGSLFGSETTISNTLQLTSSRPVTLAGPHYVADTYFNDSPLSVESPDDNSIEFARPAARFCDECAARRRLVGFRRAGWSVGVSRLQ